MTHELEENRIAVIGMAGRFPGARDVATLWNNLTAGRESVLTLTDSELAEAGVPADVRSDPTYVKKAAPIGGYDEFDAEFFNFTPHAASITDPQQRLFLQTAWHAVEDAGYDPRGLEESVGVFAASSTSGYLIHNLLSHHDVAALTGYGANMTMVSLAFANDKDYIATRVSHALDLRGPSFTVQSACSSSLLAVHLACQSLLAGECDVAIAGGTSIRVPHRVGYFAEPGSIVSPDGRCAAFDAAANGTVFGSGVGAAVLKPLSAALRDGDPIWAVVLGSAVNNDGSRKMGFSAPSVARQAEVIIEALAVAGVDPGSISYLEAHGTGTPLGDSAEIAALTQAFGATRGAEPCRIGSVKTNIGHLEVASGIAGFIKTALALRYRTLPPTLHYATPHPELALDRSVLTVHAELAEWRCAGPRRAGVSSLGVGGTNVHVVLEEAPEVAPRPATECPRVLVLSARTDTALRRMREALAAHLRSAQPDLTDTAHTLAHGRTLLPRRLAVVARETAEAARILATPGDPAAHLSTAAAVDAPADRVALMFPGQGTQYLVMGAGLYREHGTFRAAVDICAHLFLAHGCEDIRAVIFGDNDGRLRQTDIAQPALFTVGYALAKLLERYGVTPAALAGHSVGEYVAATFAGVFRLEDAAAVVAARGRLMARTPPGAMLSIRLPLEQVREALQGHPLAVAVVNDPQTCVVSGELEPVERLAAKLDERGISVRRLPTGHGFHSHLMDHVVPDFERVIAGVQRSTPTVPIVSNTTGTWMEPAEAVDPARWAHQIRSPVRFADNIAALLAEPARVLVEAGPGRTLCSAARRHPYWTEHHRAIAVLRQKDEPGGDSEIFHLGLGRLWAAGIPVTWEPVCAETGSRRVNLPGYAFEPIRHWIHPAASPPAGSSRATLPQSDNPVSESNAGLRTAPAENGYHEAAEETLAGIIRELLGVERVDREDNFFDLGVDSVVAVQVAARAAKTGLRLTPGDMFEHQTVAALITALAAGQPDGYPLARRSSAPGVPEVPLTPAQRRFLAEGLHPAQAWTVPLLLRLAPGTTSSQIAEVLAALAAHHEALRFRLTHSHGLPSQTVSPPPERYPVLTRAPRAGITADLIQDVLRELDCAVLDGPVSGSLLRAAYLAAGQGKPPYLVLSVHHLAADNASQAILLEDLGAALRQVRDGKTIDLPPATALWRVWATQLTTLASHPIMHAEFPHWLGTLANTELLFSPAPQRPASTHYQLITTALPQAQTAVVLAHQRSHRVRIEEIMLSALGCVLTGHLGRDQVCVDLQGQGRAFPVPGITLDRTVGWCTTIHPVILSPAGRTTQIPHQGIGYGLLRYLHAPTARLLAEYPEPDMFFAYLGALPRCAAPGSVVAPAFEVALPSQLTPPGLGHAVELRAYLHDDQLYLDWWYDARRAAPHVVEALAAALPASVATATAPPAPLAELAAEELDDLLAELDGVDLDGVDGGWL